ncbi:hypothetical protein [Microvirga sp. Mcv34]|uniref:hypothetical protein n=1 Tax=Microvirga sp. Mcv34 TaxID=2926016 RepID=UPI0021C835CC|nr:hypothetical protein [Microvirga sp. Mcv34]
MQSIFIGRVTSAEYVPLARQGGIFVVTYEVSEWLKGNGGYYAKVIWYPAIPCVDNCPVEETIHNLEGDKTIAIFFVEPLSRNFELAAGRSGRWDGENRLCGNPSPIAIAREILPTRASAEYNEVLFRNALRSEIEALKKRPPP